MATPLELLFDLSFVVAIALAASQLHHGVMEHHTGPALAGFVAAFSAIWWAWMNYTWFASAYDDSAVFRLRTMLQTVGVLIFAAGVPGLFNGDFRAGVLDYAVMRLALVVQWLLAARGDPACAATCRRFALGITLVQALWIARLWFPVEWLWPTFVLFMACELAVPIVAKRRHGTPWHAHHIAERYSLLLIITLGEVVLGATNAVAGMWQSFGWTLNLALVGLGSTMLAFALWWMYFLLPSGDALHRHRERGFFWGYGHFFIFASAAAMGAGLEVVADVLEEGKQAAAGIADGGHALAPAGHAGNAAHGVSPLYAISIVALAQALFMFSLWVIYTRATRAEASQGGLAALLRLACVALGRLAVWLGAALPWACCCCRSGRPLPSSTTSMDASTAPRGLRCGSGLRRQGHLDVARQAFGLVLRCVAADHASVAPDQELGEVPLDRLAAQQAGCLLFQPAEQRRGVGAVDIDLGHHRKADAVVALAKGADLLCIARLLRAELVAGEAQHRQTLGAVTLVQRLQAGVLRCEPAFAGGVDDEQHAASQIGQVQRLAIERGDCEVSKRGFGHGFSHAARRQASASPPASGLTSAPPNG